MSILTINPYETHVVQLFKSRSSMAILLSKGKSWQNSYSSHQMSYLRQFILFELLLFEFDFISYSN